MPWSSISTLSPINNLQSLDVSDDGSFVAVSFKGTNAIRSNGHVEVYRWNGTNFVKRGSTLISPTITEMGDETSGLTSSYGTEFGYDIEISNDGNFLIVSEPKYYKYYNPEPPVGNTGRYGRVLVYAYVNGEWTLSHGNYSRLYNILLGPYAGSQFGRSIKLIGDSILSIRSNGISTHTNDIYRGQIDILQRSVDNYFNYSGAGKIYNTSYTNDSSNSRRIYDMIPDAFDRDTFDIDGNVLAMGCPGINLVKIYNIENKSTPIDINTLTDAGSEAIGFGSKVRVSSDIIAVSSHAVIYVYKIINTNNIEYLYSKTITNPFQTTGSYKFDFDLIKIEDRTALAVSFGMSTTLTSNLIEIIDVENNSVIARINPGQPGSANSNDARIVFAKNTNASFFTNYNGNNWNTSNSLTLYESSEVFPTPTPTRTPTNTPTNTPTLSASPTPDPISNCENNLIANGDFSITSPKLQGWSTDNVDQY